MNEQVKNAVQDWADSLVDLLPVLSGENTSITMSDVRASYASMQARQPAPSDVTFTDIDMGGVPGLLATPAELKTDAVMIYIHGGAYIVGSPEGYRGIGGNYAKMLGARVFLPDYRMAPEHSFPVPVEDNIRVYEWLLEQGHDPKKIVLAGESAGGAMVVTVMVGARNKGLPLPLGGVSISPWANLEHTGASMTNREGLDPLNTKANLDTMARAFLGGALPNHPLASPVFADVTGLPPIMIQMGENELMLSDAMRLATHLGDNRVRVMLEVWPGMFHAWHFYPSILPEAVRALENYVAFIEQLLNNTTE